MVAIKVLPGDGPLTSSSSSSSSSDFLPSTTAVADSVQLEMERSPNTSPVSSPKSSFIKGHHAVPIMDDGGDVRIGSNTPTITSSSAPPARGSEEGTPSVRRRSNLENELNHLLEDSSRCDPRFSPTLPTSYLKSRPVVSSGGTMVTQQQQQLISNTSPISNRGSNNNSININSNSDNPSLVTTTRGKRGSISHFNSLEDFLANSNNQSRRKEPNNTKRKKGVNHNDNSSSTRLNKIKITDLLNPVPSSSTFSENADRNYGGGHSTNPNMSSSVTLEESSPDEKVRRTVKRKRLARHDTQVRVVPTLEDILDHVEVVPHSGQPGRKEKNGDVRGVRSVVSLEDILNGVDSPRIEDQGPLVREGSSKVTKTNIDGKYSDTVPKSSLKGTSKPRKKVRAVENIKAETEPEVPKVKRRGRPRKTIKITVDDTNRIGANVKSKLEALNDSHFKIETSSSEKSVTGSIQPVGNRNSENSSQKPGTQGKLSGLESPRVERRGRKRKRPLENGSAQLDGLIRSPETGDKLQAPKYRKIETSERKKKKKKATNDSVPTDHDNKVQKTGSKNRIPNNGAPRIERRGRKKKVLDGDLTNSNIVKKDNYPKVERRGRKRKRVENIEPTNALESTGKERTGQNVENREINVTLRSSGESGTSSIETDGKEGDFRENESNIGSVRSSRRRRHKVSRLGEEVQLHQETDKSTDNLDDEFDAKFSEGETERERSTFLNWAAPELELDHEFFDVSSLLETNIFIGDPLQSTALEGHTWRRNPRSKMGPKVVKLQSLLYMNYQEEYFVDFSADNSRYNPMAEVGKLVEYSALVYLPDPYAQQLKDDIIPALNYAYDTSDTDSFINEVERYNTFIRRIPRYKIIEHLKTVKKVPTTFIHDFLHVVYTRSIHPRAKKLRHYKAFSNFVYGELLPTFLTQLFNQCQMKPNQVFMDLGSGVGNCVIQAALEHGCKISLGCEIMPMASELTELQMIELKQRCRLMGLTLPPVEFRLRESFVDNPRINELITQCDVLLVNNFLFDSKLNREVEKILQHAKIGCKIISLKNLRNFGYTIDFFDVENILNRLKVEEFEFGENSVSWTHTGGRYFISTVLNDVDETLFSLNARFRHSSRRVKYAD